MRQTVRPFPKPFDMDAYVDEIAERLYERLVARFDGAKGTQLLTLKQAGEKIGRTAGAVGQLVQRGELKAVKCGRRVHIETREIESWIERWRG